MKGIRILVLVAAIDIIAVFSIFAFWADPLDCMQFTDERSNYSWPVETGETCWYYDPYTVWVGDEQIVFERWSEEGLVEDCEFYDHPEISCRPWICDPCNPDCSTNPFSN